MLTDDEINSLVHLHCGRMEDEATLQNVREAAKAIAQAAEANCIRNVGDAVHAVILDFQASGDEDLDSLVQQAMRDLCALIGVDPVA